MFGTTNRGSCALRSLVQDCAPLQTYRAAFPREVVISELARSALTGRPDEAAGNTPTARFGFQPLPKRGGIVTNEIDSLRGEESQEALALLEILALGNRQIEAGDVVPATGAVQRLRKKSRK